MRDMLIRNLDPSTHAELKRRADEAGISLQAYVTQLLQEHVRRPTLDEWVRRLEDLEVVEGVFGEMAVSAARRDLP